jgi:hypothetical protein
MTTPIGPRGPRDPALAAVLPFPRRPVTDAATSSSSPSATASPPASPASAPAPSPPPSPAAPASSSDAARFDRSTTGPVAVPLAPSTPVEGAGVSQVQARLQALGLETRKRVKTAATEPRVVDAADGRVLSGSVTIESRAGLGQLEGIARLGGSLTLQEGAVKNADLLLALRDLKVVEGRFTFDGMRNA